MREDGIGAGLNDSHRRALRSAFTYIDGLLTQVASIVSSAESPAPLARYVSDLGPTQRQVALDYVARVRGQLGEALDTLGIPREGPTLSASRAVNAMLISALVSLDEVDPAHLRGYGEVGVEAATAVARAEQEFARTLSRLRACLAQGLERDLGARLARLEGAPLDLSLLRTLERIITQRGLIELRGSLESLLQQIESGNFEIALFGRVSSGKSSLLNTVLEVDVLPVGVTPVTAVPTRVVWGEVPGAEVRFTDAPDEAISLDRLPEFASEAGNPGNRKHAVRIVVQVPSARLRPGIAFVDTPGVGSLAMSGARESYAYLPRCDLGVVLVGAGGSPARDDLELLRLLHGSGIPGMVVISKADLLAEPDRERFRAYVQREVAAGLGMDVPVHLVSTVGLDATLAREWLSRVVEPLYARARDLAEASARRKLEHLRAAVAATLRVAGSGSAAETQRASERQAEVERLVAEAGADLAEAGERCEALADRARDLAADAIARAARTLVRTGSAAGESAAPESAARSALLEAAGTAASGVQAELADLRDRLHARLSGMAEALSWPAPGPETLQLDLLTRPAVVPPVEVRGLDVRPPAWTRLSPRLAERWLGAAIRRRLAAPVTETSITLGAEVRDWSRAVLARLVEQFETQADPLRAHARRLAGLDRPSDGYAALTADLTEIEAEASRPA